jgi:hypothetical protein
MTFDELMETHELKRRAEVVRNTESICAQFNCMCSGFRLPPVFGSRLYVGKDLGENNGRCG